MGLRENMEEKENYGVGECGDHFSFQGSQSFNGCMLCLTLKNYP